MQSLKRSLKLLFSASKLSFWVMLARSISFSESLKCQSDPLLCLRGKHLHGKIYEKYLYSMNATLSLVAESVLIELISCQKER